MFTRIVEEFGNVIGIESRQGTRTPSLDRHPKRGYDHLEIRVDSAYVGFAGARPPAMPT